MGDNRYPERAEAKRLGLPFYFTGRPCVNGHIAPRYTKGDCVECIKLGKIKYPEDPEKKRQRKKRWDEDNAEHRRAYNEANKERQLEYSRRHYRKNPGYELERTARARFRRACPKWADRKALLAFYNACPPGMGVDHIVPRRGRTKENYEVWGLHVPWNLQYMLLDKNLSKGPRMTPQDQAIAESAMLSGRPRIRRPRTPSSP